MAIALRPSSFYGVVDAVVARLANNLQVRRFKRQIRGIFRIDEMMQNQPAITLAADSTSVSCLIKQSHSQPMLPLRSGQLGAWPLRLTPALPKRMGWTMFRGQSTRIANPTAVFPFGRGSGAKGFPTFGTDLIFTLLPMGPGVLVKFLTTRRAAGDARVGRPAIKGIAANSAGCKQLLGGRAVDDFARTGTPHLRAVPCREGLSTGRALLVHTPIIPRSGDDKHLIDDTAIAAVLPG